MRPFFIPRVINPHSDEEKAIRNMAITVQLVILAAVIGVTFAVSVNKWLTLTLAGFLIITILLAWRGFVSPGQILTPIAVTAVSLIFMLTGNGMHDIAIIGLAGSIVIAGLFLGSRGTIFATITAIAVMVSLGAAEVSGRFVPNVVERASPEELVISAILLLAVGLSLQTTLSRLKRVAIQARENEAAQTLANSELLQLKTSLEARVDERTTELGRRASQLDAISKVARAISAVQDLERLLPNITNVVSEQFGFYHTGIFLTDERSEFAVLRAANSEGGQRMLKRGHRLRLGATSIVGYTATSGDPRVALDVGADSVYFNNPDLPGTRSEMALPLKSGNDVVGVLDVQSTETNAFLPEDISVLTTLANQIAIAIENSQLFSQTREALAESQSVYNEYVKREWIQFGRKLGQIGFVYDGIRTAPLASDSNETNTANTRVPIKIRGATVGFITLRSNDPERTWTQDEINLARSAAERAGLAIENVRLLDEAQRRAAKERTIGEISSRIASSIDMNDIMQTAVEELGHALPGSEIVLQFENKLEKDESRK